MIIIMLNNIKPKIGRLLISEPFMADPNFKRSVVLLTEHGDDGTVGYILNQVGNLILNDVIQDLRDAKTTFTSVDLLLRIPYILFIGVMINCKVVKI